MNEIYFFTAGVMTLGGLVGCFTGAVQSEKLGRKKSLLIDSVLYIIGESQLIDVFISR